MSGCQHHSTEASMFACRKSDVRAVVNDVDLDHCFWMELQKQLRNDAR